jgi:hypothetical protein
MIDPGIKEEIRGHIVRANIALHKNKFIELTECLRVAQILSGSISKDAAGESKRPPAKAQEARQDENLRLF